MVRIRGLVKATERVRSRLQTGIPPGELSDFRQFVTETLETVEQICTEANATPQQLPTPSQKAYTFLKAARSR